MIGKSRGLSQVEVHKERKELFLLIGLLRTRRGTTKDHDCISLTVNHLPSFVESDAVLSLPSPTNFCLISRARQGSRSMGHQAVHDILQMDDLRKSRQKEQEMALVCIPGTCQQDRIGPLAARDRRDCGRISSATGIVGNRLSFKRPDNCV